MTRIRRYIDDPPGLFFWDMDQVVVFSTTMGAGIFMHMLFWCLLMGTGSAWLLGKVKGTRSEGYFLHVLYWHGLLPLRGTPPSHIRTLVE